MMTMSGYDNWVHPHCNLSNDAMKFVMNAWDQAGLAEVALLNMIARYDENLIPEPQYRIPGIVRQSWSLRTAVPMTLHPWVSVHPNRLVE